MHSFTTASFFALALAAFTSAVPVMGPAPLVVRDVQTPPVPAAPATPVTLPVIFNDATQRVAPIVATLQSITNGDATYQVLKPVLEELKVVLTQTINAVEAITKDPLDTVLGTLTVPQLARLVAALITTVISALGAVLASLNAADRVVIIPLLSDVSGLVGQLLEVVLKLVGELLVEIVPLLRGILKFVIDLNVRYILGLLL